MKSKVTILDYGSGNILSAMQSFAKVIKIYNLDADVKISQNPESIKNSSHIVLPGQGAFETCIKGLKKNPRILEELENFALIEKKPFFGICVGMQLLADNSEENGNHEGLGWINGTIKKIPSNQLKMPHMGWNSIKVLKNKKNLLKPKETDYYFVHSYYFDCKNKDHILAETNYGINFPSIVNKENIYGFQFHPEKSSEHGLNIIKNFLKL